MPPAAIAALGDARAKGREPCIRRAPPTVVIVKPREALCCRRARAFTGLSKPSAVHPERAACRRSLDRAVTVERSAITQSRRSRGSSRPRMHLGERGHHRLLAASARTARHNSRGQRVAPGLRSANTTPRNESRASATNSASNLGATRGRPGSAGSLAREHARDPWRETKQSRAPARRRRDAPALKGPGGRAALATATPSRRSEPRARRGRHSRRRDASRPRRDVWPGRSAAPLAAESPAPPRSSQEHRSYAEDRLELLALLARQRCRELSPALL